MTEARASNALNWIKVTTLVLVGITEHSIQSRDASWLRLYPTKTADAEVSRAIFWNGSNRAIESAEVSV